MKKAAIILTLMLTFLVRSSYSIQESAKDSSETRTYFPQYYGDKNWRFLLGFDAKRSFYAGYPVKFNGLRIGAEYKGVHRFDFRNNNRMRLEFIEFLRF